MSDVPQETYAALVADVFETVRAAQRAAVSQSNAVVVAMYWNIGRYIVERQHVERYGSSVIERLSTDLRAQFPGQRGFSVRNLHYMRSFAAAWPDQEILQQLLQNLGWGQIQSKQSCSKSRAVVELADDKPD